MGKKRLLIPVAFAVEWDKLLTKKSWKSNQIKVVRVVNRAGGDLHGSGIPARNAGTIEK